MRLLFVLMLSLLLVGCTQYGQDRVNVSPTAMLKPLSTATAEPVQSNQGANIANPASVHCTSLGYRNEIVDAPQGQSGVCIFSDGSSCDDWAFLRGECGQSFSACAKEGGRLGATLMGPNGPVKSNSTCQFSDGTICEETDLAASTCKPGQRVA